MQAKRRGASPDETFKAKRIVVDSKPVEPRSPALDGRDSSADPGDMALDELAAASSSRPDLPNETPDGLDDTDEEIRRQAEDLPVDAPGRTR